MHFLKYVGIIILFYSILFMWTRCGYQMFLCAPPPVPMTILISFTLALPRPLPHTRSRRGTRGIERSGHMYMVRLAISGGHPPLPLLSSGFLLKAAPFYCIFSSTRRALEVCTSHSSSGCSTAFFPLHYSIDVSNPFFSLSLTFLAIVAFSSNVEF